MSIDSEFEELERAHRAFLVAYTILTEKKIKSKAPEARKALMDIIAVAKELRKSVQAYKDSI
jgi:hypothetical protein